MDMYEDDYQTYFGDLIKDALAAELEYGNPTKFYELYGGVKGGLDAVLIIYQLINIPFNTAEKMAKHINVQFFISNFGEIFELAITSNNYNKVGSCSKLFKPVLH